MAARITCKVDQIADLRGEPALAANQRDDLGLDQEAAEAGRGVGRVARIEQVRAADAQMRGDRRAEREVGQIGIAELRRRGRRNVLRFNGFRDGEGREREHEGEFPAHFFP